MSTSTQIIFSRAVKHHLHDGFVSLLDRIDEFNLGAVFTYHGKPHFWRKKELDFTGAQFSDILTKTEGAAEAGFTYKNDSRVLFDETSDSSQRTVDIDLDLDGEVKIAMADVGGDVGGSGKKMAKINVSLGTFTHITTDMGSQLTGQKFTVNLEHPVIREAVDKGKTLFVISSLFQSQKVEITISREEDVALDAKESLGDTNNENTDSAAATGTSTATTTTTGNSESKSEGAVEKVVGEVEDVGKDIVSKGLGVPQIKEELKGDTKSVTTGITVTKRERLSNIGFSVLRIDIGKDGSLTPQAKIGVSYDNKIHATYGDAFVSVDATSTPSGDSADKKEEGKGLEPPKEDKEDTKDKDNQSAENANKDAPNEGKDSTPPSSDK